MPKQVGREIFNELLSLKFPDVAGTLREERQLLANGRALREALGFASSDEADETDDADEDSLYGEMPVLCHATEAAMERDDLAAVADHFAFVKYLYEAGTPVMRSVVVVCYLEHLDLEKHPRSAALLPASLVKALDELWAALKRGSEETKPEGSS